MIHKNQFKAAWDKQNILNLKKAYSKGIRQLRIKKTIFKQDSLVTLENCNGQDLTTKIWSENPER